MSSEHVEVLRDLSEVCRAAIKAGDWKVDGACDPDAVLRRADSAIAALSAPQPPSEAHCATCSCVPGMTPAVRFDTTPAEKEGAVRDHLIRMGWTPPTEAQAQGGGEVAMEAWSAALNDAGELRSNAPDERYERRAQNVEAWIRANRPSPPSAPVGVEAKDAEIEALRAEVRDAYAAEDSKAGWEWKKRAEAAEARAERLAEALRECPSRRAV